MQNKEKYEIYADLLQKWSTSLNLISPSTLNDIEARHIQDSEQLLAFIRPHHKVVDLGSGAGFPGLVLAMNGIDVTLIESDQKKCVFLENVSRETRTKATIVCDRIENVQTTQEFDVITSRALADLTKLITLSKNLATQNKTRGLFLKGASVSSEIHRLEQEDQRKTKSYPSMTSSNSMILEYFF
jgi:16S rRNA (guanine527-N7)-methyltransferase